MDDDLPQICLVMSRSTDVLIAASSSKSCEGVMREYVFIGVLCFFAQGSHILSIPSCASFLSYHNSYS